jgi:hypothetical protein
MQKQNGSTRYVANLNAKMVDALGAVRVAQDELAAAMIVLVPVAIGDKQLITRSLEGSFRKVRTAQDQVCKLQRLLARA